MRLFLLIFAVLVSSWIPEAYAQPTTIYTPDADRNAQLRSESLRSAGFAEVRLDDGDLTFVPKLQDDWRWLAAKDADIGAEEPLTFFVLDGYIYATRGMRSTFRRIKGDDVSDQVSSNAFHIALLSEEDPPETKDNELFLFVATDEAKAARVTLPAALVGTERTFTFDLEAGGFRFLRMVTTEGRMPEQDPLYVARESPRTQMDLTQGWRFHRGEAGGAEEPGFDDAAWQRVTVPHSWNATDVFDGRNVSEGLDVYTTYWRGPSWYRKHFSLDETLDGRHLMLHFEAANQVADVWLNGQKLGRHRGGYTPFAFDATEAARLGAENVLAVRVDNSYRRDTPPHLADFNMMGGLTREVSLEATAPVHVASTYVTTPELSHAEGTVRVETALRNDGDVAEAVQLKTLVVDPDGFIAAALTDSVRLAPGQEETVTQTSAPIETPRLWSPSDPALYAVQSHVTQGEALVDATTAPLGFRWFEFDSQEGFFLNGERLALRGVALHQDRLGYGPAVPDSLRVQDLEMIKAMGGNFIRLSHYPHDASVVHAADRLGIVLWEEIPFVNTVGREAFEENAVQQLRAMIRRDRNHPSVVFWGLANETLPPWLSEEDLRWVKRVTQRLHDTAKEEDPTRLTAQGQNEIADTSVVEITDVIGRNRYFGWYEGEIEEFGRALDEEHRRYPHWRILVSEYGAGAKRGYHVEDPERFDFSETYQLRFHEGHLDQIEARPWIGASAAWNAFDFASQNKIGNIPRINQKGLASYDRQPKDVYYLYQSRLTDEPMVYIVSHTQRVRRGPAEQPVRVLSNAGTVELFLNGRSLGTQEEAFVWQVPFAEGANTLRAVARPADGRPAVTDEMTVTYFPEDAAAESARR